MGVEGFDRQERYTVFKDTDVGEALTPDQCTDLIQMHETMQASRENNGKAPLVCLVIEEDWPEYEIVWKMIEKRCRGNPV